MASAGADGARHPVHRAQFVDDLALDPGHRVGLELHVAPRVVALDRADQAEEAVGDEVTLVHMGRQSGAQPAGDVLHERRVREDEAVADLLVAGPPEFEPQLLGLVGHRHDGENTAFPGGLLSASAPAAAESARRQRGEPRGDGDGGEADDEPTDIVCARERVPRDSRQRGREDGEQQPERVPLHAPEGTGVATNGLETHSVHWPTGTGA